MVVRRWVSVTWSKRAGMGTGRRRSVRTKDRPALGGAGRKRRRMIVPVRKPTPWMFTGRSSVRWVRKPSFLTRHSLPESRSGCGRGVLATAARLSGGSELVIEHGRNGLGDVHAGIEIHGHAGPVG